MTAIAARRRHPLATAALLLLGLLVTGMAYSLAVPRQADGATTSSADVEAGHKLFLANCATCHGENAEGRGEFPSLVGVGAAAVDFQVGTGRMPLQATGPQAVMQPVQLSDRDIEQLAAYVASLAPGPAVPDADAVDPTKGDSARGSLIFRTNCAMCHNFAGKGGALTRGKYAPDLSETSGKHIYEAMETGPQSMPVFTDQTVDPETKRDMIAFLYSVREAPSPGGLSLGSLGPVPEGLVGWLLGLGLLIGATVWIGAKSS